MILVVGSVRAPVEALPRLRDAMAAVLTTTRQEDGCVEYAYAEDVLDPGLIRVTEVWRDMAALQRHSTQPHMTAWRAACAEAGVGERRLFVYEAGQPREF